MILACLILFILYHCLKSQVQQRLHINLHTPALVVHVPMHVWKKQFPTNRISIIAIKMHQTHPACHALGTPFPPHKCFSCCPFCSAPEWSWRVWNRTWYQGPESSLFAAVLTGRVKNHSFVPWKKEPSSDLMVAQCNVKRPRGLCGVATPTLLWSRRGIRPGFPSISPEWFF